MRRLVLLSVLLACCATPPAPPPDTYRLKFVDDSEETADGWACGRPDKSKPHEWICIDLETFVLRLQASAQPPRGL